MPIIHDPVNVRGLSASLKILRLSDCNLWTIPSDFGYWSSPLEDLDLSGNYFDSLPNSFDGFSRLKYFSVARCLRLLREPPFSTEASHCTSLMRFDWFKFLDYIQSDFFWLAFGSEIPKWFNNQRIGHKVKIQVPS